MSLNRLGLSKIEIISQKQLLFTLIFCTLLCFPGLTPPSILSLYNFILLENVASLSRQKSLMKLYYKFIDNSILLSHKFGFYIGATV